MEATSTSLPHCFFATFEMLSKILKNPARADDGLGEIEVTALFVEPTTTHTVSGTDFNMKNPAGWIIVSFLISSVSCAPLEPEKNRTKSSEGGDSSDLCKKTSKLSGTQTELQLLETPTYKSGVSTILEDKCVGCHRPDATSPDLSTHELAQKSGAGIKTSVSDDSMPPDGSPDLTDDEKKKLIAWVDAGAPLDSSGDGSTDGKDGDKSSNNDDESKNDSNQNDTPAECNLDAETVLQTAAVSKCHKKGKIYDRQYQECGTASLDTSYTCSRSGLKKAFASYGADISQTLKESLGKKGDKKDNGEGYVIDQCGETSDGLPVAYLIKLTDDQKKLKVRLLALE